MEFKKCLIVLFFVSSVLGKPSGLDSANELQSCGVNSICVRFFSCENGKTVSDGTGIRDIRSVPKLPCPHYLDVCCTIDNIQPEIKPKSEPSAAASDDMKPPQCGFRNKEGLGPQPNTTDKNTAKRGEFPWNLIVLEKKEFGLEPKNFYLCGASLIHPSVVLTSAHHVSSKNADSLRIRAGQWDSESTQEPLDHVEVDVESYIIHKDFNADNSYNDIALLFLKTPLTKDNHINTICLPPQDMEFDDAKCFATSMSKKMELPIVSHSTCEKKLQDERLSKVFKLHYSFLCAGGEEGIDMCRNDGGSPLVCPIEGQDGYYYQTGIVSWGIGCGKIGVPGVYTKVSQFRNWIDQQIAEKFVTTN
ncbi:unnamed protein product [Diamesa serratosioi]